MNKLLTCTFTIRKLSPMNKKLSKAIKDYGQANLVRDTGLSKSMVSLVVNGKRSLGRHKAKVVAEILNIPLQVALGID